MRKIILLLALYPILTQAQSPIYFEHYSSSNDIVGSRLAYKVKEHIRLSQNMQLVVDEDEAIIKIILQTMPYEDTGYITIYSVVWTVRQLTYPHSKIYWDSELGYCGGGRVNDMAETIIADTDKILTRIQSIIYKVYKEENQQ